MMLCAETMILYAFAISIAGSILITVFIRFNLIPMKWKWAWPVLFLCLIILIDLIGWNCRIRTVFTEPVFGTEQAKESESNLDLLLITLDTCRADRLGCYGHAEATTPTLDALSRHGIQFSEAISTIPVTTSAHATIMTGLEPHSHGSRFNAVPLKSNVTTLAEILRDEGYRTGGFASAFPVTAAVSGLNRGFTFFDQTLTPRYFHPLIYQSTLLSPFRSMGRLRPAERRSEQVEPWVDAWWRSLPDAPSRFTWIHYYDPHAPYNPPEWWRKWFAGSGDVKEASIVRIHDMNRNKPPDTQEVKINMALYDGEIAQTDRAIERILRIIAENNRKRSTLIMVIADHGESLAEHHYFFTHGDNTLDPSIRIPFIVSPFSGISANLNMDRSSAASIEATRNRLIEEQVGIADVAPTALTLLRYGSSIQMDGRHLLDNTNGKESSSERPLFCESGAGVYIEPHTANYEKINQKERSVRTRKFKVVRESTGEARVYNLEIDPRELTPLRIEDVSAAADLKHQLDRKVAEEGGVVVETDPIHDEETIDQLRELGYVDK